MADLTNYEKVREANDALNEKNQPIDATYRRFTSALDYCVNYDKRRVDILKAMDWTIEQREKIKVAIQALGTGMPDDEIFYNYYKWIGRGGIVPPEKEVIIPDDPVEEGEETIDIEYNARIRVGNNVKMYRCDGGDRTELLETFAMNKDNVTKYLQSCWSSAQTEDNHVSVINKDGESVVIGGIEAMRSRVWSTLYGSGTLPFTTCGGEFRSGMYVEMTAMCADGEVRNFSSLIRRKNNTGAIVGTEATADRDGLNIVFNCDPGATTWAIGRDQTPTRITHVAMYDQFDKYTSTTTQNLEDVLVFESDCNIVLASAYDRIEFEMEIAITSDVPNFAIIDFGYRPTWDLLTGGSGSSRSTIKIEVSYLYDDEYRTDSTKSPDPYDKLCAMNYETDYKYRIDSLSRRYYNYSYYTSIFYVENYEQIYLTDMELMKPDTNEEWDEAYEPPYPYNYLVYSFVIKWADSSPVPPGPRIEPTLNDMGDGLHTGDRSTVRNRTAPISSQEVERETEDITDETAKQIVTYALEHVGVKYSMDQNKRLTGNSNPNGYLDCSSLAYYACLSAGVNIGVTAKTAANEAHYLYNEDVTVASDELLPGDLIFYALGRSDAQTRWHKISHVAIYIGNGMIVDASSSVGKVVKRSRNNGNKYGEVLYARPALLGGV